LMGLVSCGRIWPLWSWGSYPITRKQRRV
jgi:hypothetical protein